MGAVAAATKRGRPPAPFGRLPRRYKKGGKFVGSFYFRVGKKDINLRTQDANVANARAEQAKKGKRDFKDDSQGGRAAQAIADSLAGTGAAKPAPVVEPAPPAASEFTPGATTSAPEASPTHTTAPALPPIPEAAASSQPPPVMPDGYIPPADWAEKVRAAAGAAGAAEAEGASSSSSSSSGDGLDDVIDAGVIDDLVDQVAEGIVGAQIALQAHAARKGWIGVRVKAAAVPDDAKGREVGKRIWKRALRRLVDLYMPGLDIPDWIAAPMAVAFLTVPIQFGEGAEIIPDDAPEETAAGSDAPAAAA